MFKKPQEYNRLISNLPTRMAKKEISFRKDLPATVYRCKGIVFIAEHFTKRFCLQVVKRRAEIIELGDWKSQKPSNQVVAIGSSINENELNSNFKKCKAGFSNIH